MGSLNGFTGSLGDLVVDIGTGDLGHGVAVLHLNGDKFDLGVVNTVLGGNFTTSVLDSGSERVSNSVGSNWSNVNRGNSKRSSKGMGSIWMSKGFSISLTLANGVVSKGRLVTQGVNDFLADLLVFNLFGLDSLSGANILGRWNTCLCCQDLDVSFAVGSRDNSGMVRGSKELGISLSFRSRGSAGKGKKTRNSKYLHHAEIV